MKFLAIIFVLFLSIIECVFGHYHGNPIFRHKRDAVGALEIVTNNAKPIHAEVKSAPVEAPSTAAAVDTQDSDPVSPVTEKPCPDPILPSRIEPGVVFKVVPPTTDVVFEGKSGRKSLLQATRFELIRSISRLCCLFVLILSAVVEFFPLLQQMYFLYYLN